MQDSPATDAVKTGAFVGLTDEQVAEIHSAVAAWPPLSAAQRQGLATLFTHNESGPTPY